MKKLLRKITAVFVAAGLMFPTGTLGNIDFGLAAFAEETGYTNGFCDTYTAETGCSVHGADCNGYQPAKLTNDKYNIDGVDGYDEVYEIGNAGQLYWFAALVNGTNGLTQNLSANAVLTDNITVNAGDVANCNGTKAAGWIDWTPIVGSSYPNYYAGTFDGQNHTVSGLYFNDSSVSKVGLFGATGSSSKISNVGVVDSYFCGKNWVGGVCGEKYGTAENCYSASTVSGASAVGGVCGDNCGRSKLINCYNTGTVIGTGNYIGGVCGILNSGTISNCYFDSSKYGKNAVGSPNGAVEKTEGKTAEQFASGEVCYLLNGGKTDGSQVWYQTLNSDSYPLLNNSHGTVYASKPCPIYFSNTDNFAEEEHNYVASADYTKHTCTKCGETHDIAFIANDETNTISVCHGFGSVTLKAPTGNLTDDGTAKAATIGADDKIEGFDNPKILYKLKDGTEEATETAPTNAGTYTASITYTYGGNTYSVSVEYTIGKATPTVTAPTAKTGLVYTGTAQALIAAGSTDIGTLLYSLDGTNYSEDIPTATKADSYTVYYKVQGNDNVSDVDAKTVSASIDKATPGGDTQRDINVVRGVGTFTEPVFTGVDGQPLGGGVKYGKLDYSQEVEYLKTLSDAICNCNFEFTPDDVNYNNVTGFISFYIYDVAFKVGNDDATAENAVTVRANPTYGDTWAEILTLNNRLKAVLFNFLNNALDDSEVTTGFSLDVTGSPDAGSQTYNVLFNGTVGGKTYTDHVVATGTVDVAKKELTVSAGDFKVSKVYDGTTNAGASTGELEISGLVGTDTVTITPTIGDYSLADVGTSNVTVTISFTDASGNYKLGNTTVSVPAEITAKAITPTVEGSGTHTYTGSAITPNVTVKDGETVLEEDKDYTITVTNNINAGMATVTITAKSGGNYTFDELTRYFKIFKATPNVTAPTAKTGLVYNGTAKELISAGSTNFGTLLYSLDGTNYSTSVPTGTNADSYTVYYKVQGNDNVNNVDAQNFTVTINKATPNVTAPTAKTGLVYKGTAQELVTAGSTDIGTLLYSLDNITYSENIPTTTNAGSYTVYYKVQGNSNVNDVAEEPISVSIGKVPVTITANSYTVKVNTELPTFDYKVSGLVNNEKIEDIVANVAVSCQNNDGSAPSAIGEYTIDVSGLSETTNYKLTYVDGTLTITDKAIQTITAADVTLTYGKTGKISARASGGGEISCAVKTGGDVINVAADGTITALKAGTAVVEVTAAANDDYGKAIKAVAVTVNKAAVTIKANSYTVKVGGDFPALDYTVTGLADGETLSPVPELSCETDNTSTAGTYKITVKFNLTEDDKYIYTVQNGTLTVQRKSAGGAGGSSGGGSRPTTPTTTNPSIGGSSKSWSDVAADLGKLTSDSEATIELNGSTTVPVDVIKAIADTGSNVKLVINSAYAWVVDGADITAPAAADLTFVKTASTKSDGLRGVEGTQFRINNTNIPTNLEIAFKKQHAGKFANLYKNVDGKLTFVTCAKLGADGKVILPEVTEKGDYVSMLCEYSDRPGDMSNDGKLNVMDAVAVLKNAAGVEKGKNPLVADMNNDGRINVFDATAILKRIAGKA